MRLEYACVVETDKTRLWKFLLDPTKLVDCISGVENVKVINDDEYEADIRIKISFISARFLVKVRIIERREPEYLLCEGSGEDRGIASSMSQKTEILLTEVAGNRTQLEVNSEVDVLGRLGALGLAAMKTKADRMWKEFAASVNERLAEDVSTSGTVVASSNKHEPSMASLTLAARGDTPSVPPRQADQPKTMLDRLLGRQRSSRSAVERTEGDFIFELIRADYSIKVTWPVSHSELFWAWIDPHLEK